MKLKNLLLIIIGVAVGLFAVQVYRWLMPRSSVYYYEGTRLVSLNEEISEQRSNAIVVAAQKVSPSVASITVVQTKVVSASPFFSPFADEFFRDFFGDFFPERYHKQQIRNLGTGSIISPDGYIVTNEHLISNATQIKVTLPDSRQFEGRVIASDISHDLALIKIDVDNVPHATLGNSDDLMIGEWVVAFGNPFGFLLEDTRPTVTVGVVSALNRSIKSTREDRVYKNMIQTDAAINPGNSGGPLVNVLGEVVGLNTAIFTSGGGSEGIGFARPINDVKKFINEAREHGRVRVPWIGLWIKDIPEEAAESSNIEPRGVLVSGVDVESAAYESGIREGDRVISINNTRIESVADWNRFASNVFVDDRLEVTFIRNDNREMAAFVVEEFSEEDMLRTRVVIYGIQIQNIDTQLAKKYRLAYSDGVVVTDVEANSVGDKLGIMPGDVVLMIGNVRIHNKTDFQKALRYQRDMSIIIDRNGRIIQLYLGV
jgi:serine protease Do